MQIKILLATSSIMDTWEACTALSRKLLDENQLVGILGPEGLSQQPHDNLQIFHTLKEAQEFEPRVVLPLDAGAAGTIMNYWEDCKAHTLYKDRLGLALNQLRSFGLSILASAGLPTVNHMVLSNQNDYLRYEAKRQAEPGEWELFIDHPLASVPEAQGNLAVQKAYGDELSMCFLVSDSKAVKGEDDGAPVCLPPLAFRPLRGLLRKGGIKDYRGLVGKFVTSPAALALSRKVKSACQSIGLKGLVFLDQIYGKEGLAVRLHSTAPPGFLSLLLHSGLLEGPFHEIMLSLLKDRRFPLRHSAEARVGLVVGNAMYQVDRAPIEWGAVPGLVPAPSLPVPCYEMGYVTPGPGMNVPEDIWDICPTAEVKLDLGAELEEFSTLLLKLGLEKEKEGQAHGSNSKGE